MEQYAPGSEYIYSYHCNRSSKTFGEHMFFGLQYYLLNYLSKPLTREMGDEFIQYRNAILGNNSERVNKKIYELCDLGYFPLKIKALPEGVVTPKHIPLFTITNTIPSFHWSVGFVESLLLKTWYTSLVATNSFHYRKLVEHYFDKSVDEDSYFLKDFTVHDFGYRGDRSEESAAISGVAHLINSKGSDTVPALPTAVKFYNADINDTMFSVPASEHSVACSFTKEREFDYYNNMLELYPDGIVSIVSDQYDMYKVFTEYLPKLKDKIIEREGKTVFRPDSGNQEDIICGNKNADILSPERLGALGLIDKVFGHKVNNKGYRVLDQSVGLIYGDGMSLSKYETVLERMIEDGWSAENLVIGSGTDLRSGNRDTLGTAIKASMVRVNGKNVSIFKDPVTDQGKKSLKGLFVVREKNNVFTVEDNVSMKEEEGGCLEDVYLDGKVLRLQSLDQIRDVAQRYL